MNIFRKIDLPPTQYKKVFHKLFDQHKFKDYQMKILGISKKQMIEYLWNSLKQDNGLLFGFFKHEQCCGFIKFFHNKFVSKNLFTSSWSIHHLHFDQDVTNDEKNLYISDAVSYMKENKQAEFIDIRVAPDDKNMLSILQDIDFNVIGGTVNCIVKTIEKEPQFNTPLSISPALPTEGLEIHKLVCNNHHHNHFYYDIHFKREDVKNLYGQLVCKTIEMENAETLVARDPDGSIAGIITYKTSPPINNFIDQNLASLDFIAVDMTKRRKGLGDFLNKQALFRLHQLGIKKAVVRTMYNNYAALSILQKLNMKISSSDMILHKRL